MYWDRQAFANSEDPDQMLQNDAYNQDVRTVCHIYGNVSETSSDTRMDYFKF